MHVHAHTYVKSYLKGKEAGKEIGTDDLRNSLKAILYNFSFMFQTYEIHFSSI